VTHQGGQTRFHNAVRGLAASLKIRESEAVKLVKARAGYSSISKIYAYMRGERTPSARGQHRLAQAVGSTADYLWGDQACGK
jgi:hypothetical protein